MFNFKATIFFYLFGVLHTLASKMKAKLSIFPVVFFYFHVICSIVVISLSQDYPTQIAIISFYNS